MFDSRLVSPGRKDATTRAEPSQPSAEAPHICSFLRGSRGGVCLGQRKLFLRSVCQQFELNRSLRNQREPCSGGTGASAGQGQAGGGTGTARPQHGRAGTPASLQPAAWGVGSPELLGKEYWGYLGPLLGGLQEGKHSRGEWSCQAHRYGAWALLVAMVAGVGRGREKRDDVNCINIHLSTASGEGRENREEKTALGWCGWWGWWGWWGSGSVGLSCALPLASDARMKKMLLPPLTQPQLAAAEKGRPDAFGKSSEDLC